MSERKYSTYSCCCCSKSFQLDVTDDPDPRPSPLGDQCPECKAAGKQRPFEASGQTLTGQMAAVACCRLCKGNHWAMDCTGAEAQAVMAGDPYYSRMWKPIKAGAATSASAGATAGAAAGAASTTAPSPADGTTAETAVKVAHHIW